MVAIIRRNPSRDLTMVEPFAISLVDEVDRMARSIWENWQPVVYTTDLSPRIDMFEEKDELVMRTELPGIKKEDIDIQLEGDRLVIKAEKKEETLSEDTNYYTCERRFGQYQRSVSLPFPVEADKISTTFENGLLEIRLPKAEELKAKHIEIK